jgi:hypothetical protein
MSWWPLTTRVGCWIDLRSPKRSPRGQPTQSGRRAERGPSVANSADRRPRSADGGASKGPFRRVGSSRTVQRTGIGSPRPSAQGDRQPPRHRDDALRVGRQAVLSPRGPTGAPGRLSQSDGLGVHPPREKPRMSIRVNPMASMKAAAWSPIASMVSRFEVGLGVSIQESRSRRCWPTRRALAMMVSVRLTAPMETKKLESTR